MADYRKNSKKKYQSCRQHTRADVIRWIAVSLLTAAVLFTAGLFCYTAYRLTGTIFPTAELFDGKPTIRFVDVGQGDCTLITYRGDAVLIDAGPGSCGDITAEYIRMYAPEIDYFIITHPHEDHLGGAADILSSVKVKTLVMSDIEVEDDFFIRTIETAEKRSTEIVRLDAGASFTVGSITAEILDVFGFPYEDLNDASMVTRVTVGETTLLITGDAETGEENYLLASCADQLDCDILRVGHHGSKTSTNEEFLHAASPEICVISVGRGNSYGHPAQEVLGRISTYGAELHRTDREGHVVIRGEASESGGLFAVWQKMQ